MESISFSSEAQKLLHQYGTHYGTHSQEAATTIQKHLRARVDRAQVMTQLLNSDTYLSNLVNVSPKALERTNHLFLNGIISVTDIPKALEILSSPIGQFTLSGNPAAAIKAVQSDISCELGAGFNALHLAAIVSDAQMLNDAIDYFGAENMDCKTQKSTFLDNVLRFQGVPAANGDSGFMIALFLGRKEIAETLMQRGAQCNFANSTGNTPLNISAGGCPELLEAICQNLQSQGQLSECMNRQTVPGGSTPLHHAAKYAVKTGDFSSVDTLLTYGAAESLAIEDSGGHTPSKLLVKHLLTMADNDRSLAKFETGVQKANQALNFSVGHDQKAMVYRSIARIHLGECAHHGKRKDNGKAFMAHEAAMQALNKTKSLTQNFGVKESICLQTYFAARKLYLSDPSLSLKDAMVKARCEYLELTAQIDKVSNSLHNPQLLKPFLNPESTHSPELQLATWEHNRGFVISDYPEAVDAVVSDARRENLQEAKRLFEKALSVRMSEDVKLGAMTLSRLPLVNLELGFAEHAAKDLIKSYGIYKGHPDTERFDILHDNIQKVLDKEEGLSGETKEQLISIFKAVSPQPLSGG